MMLVQFRFQGDALWRSFLAPTGLPAAWTLARAIKTQQQPEVVQIQPSKPPQGVDLRA